MNISLPSELEKMVKDRVNSGIYGSASEVIRAALRKFFHITEDDEINPVEMEHIRETIAPRLEALKNGSAVLHDFEGACEEINKEIFD